MPRIGMTTTAITIFATAATATAAAAAAQEEEEAEEDDHYDLGDHFLAEEDSDDDENPFFQRMRRASKRKRGKKDKKSGLERAAWGFFWQVPRDGVVHVTSYCTSPCAPYTPLSLPYTTLNQGRAPEVLPRALHLVQAADPRGPSQGSARGGQVLRDRLTKVSRLSAPTHSPLPPIHPRPYRHQHRRGEDA